MRTSRFGIMAVAVFALAFTSGRPAGAEKVAKLPPGARIGNYVGEDVMIPMRDGVRLHAQVWRPRTAIGKLPILMQRSPYGFELAAVERGFATEYKELAAEGFIFVLQDIRGRFGSEGEFVMLRPSAVGPKEIDESTDAYDSIEWLTRSLPGTNGNVGIFGISYMGWSTAMATINPHPALKAVSVQASPEDMFIGDDFHRNGAFRLDYAWEYAAALETDGRTLNAFSFGGEDLYSWYLKQAPLATLDQRSLGRSLPTWQNFVSHPNYDRFWKSGLTSQRMPAKPKIPNLVVAGWWDQEDFYGPLTIYRRQEEKDADGRNFLVVGPWNHGGWAWSEGEKYGPYPLGSATSSYFRGQVETPWFRYWLKGEGTLDQPEALIFESGSNRWVSHKSWPPREGVVRKQLYFHANGRLSFDPPASAADEVPDRYVSDPANPVPYRERPIAAIMAEDSSWPVWIADDQAPFAKRPDVLSWQTDVLDRDVTIRGSILAKLYASTTGSDADWVVKLVDIYPSDETVDKELRGRHRLIANNVFRGRFRSSFERPRALEPGKVLDYAIDLHSASHVFKKGHRIGVQIQSSWFPLIDRNPQTFTPSIFSASGSDFKAQTHDVYHSRRYPSSMVIDMPDDR